ncbi:hypothetical protein GCM10027047_29670 [Rhodococcus aerolatus]
MGTGAMGTVWLARDERLDREVALKQVFGQGAAADDDEAQHRRAAVLREGRAAARVRHAHAVTVQDVTVDGGRAWLVMDHFPSESLGAQLRRSGPLPVAEAARLGAAVAGALAAAHDAGVVHADVKPGNVLVGEGRPPTARLTDFGIARMMSEAAGSAEDDIVGTPVYFSPEVARGADPTPASDVFSLGSTVWTLVVGAPPFGSDEDTRALLRRVAAAELPDTAPVGALGPVLTRLMAPHPADRPDAATARDLLAAVARGEAPRAPAPAPAAAEDAPGPAVRLRDADEDAPRGGPPVVTVAVVLAVLVALLVVVGVVVAGF